MLLILLCYQLTVALVVSGGQLSLFMPKEETAKLLGVDAEVYYIFKGRLMVRALDAALVMNGSYTQHVLYWWNADSAKQVGYRISFSTNYPDGIHLPVKLNVSTSGFVPRSVAALQMTFNCTGRRSSVKIDIILSLSNMSGSNDVTNITLKRRKLCIVPEVVTQRYHVISGKSSNTSQHPVYGGFPVTDSPEYVPSANMGAKPTSTEIFYVAVAVASAVIILVAVIIFTLYIRTRKHTLLNADRPSVIGSSNHDSSFLRLDGNKNSSLMSLPSSRRATLSSFSMPPSASTQDVQVSLGSLAINRNSVNLGEVMLTGTYGKVYHGVVYVQDESEECYEQKVLIKSSSEEASDEQIKNLLLEGSMLKGLNHQYINPVIAACLEKPSLLIYPHSDKGNLKTLLKQSNRISNQLPCLNTQQLVNMAIQAVKGIHYLHRKHIIHKDIAARNCCVDSNYNIKVTDYALSRDLFPDDYVCLGDHENKPVKWMAVESLLDKRYSYATDTWSFGVLLWELITFAQQPYSDVDAFEISSYLQSGYRLLQPINCPDELFAVMAYCWAMQPHDRPSLHQILVCLQEFHKTLSSFI